MRRMTCLILSVERTDDFLFSLRRGSHGTMSVSHGEGRIIRGHRLRW